MLLRGEGAEVDTPLREFTGQSFSLIYISPCNKLNSIGNRIDMTYEVIRIKRPFRMHLNSGFKIHDTMLVSQSNVQHFQKWSTKSSRSHSMSFVVVQTQLPVHKLDIHSTFFISQLKNRTPYSQKSRGLCRWPNVSMRMWITIYYANRSPNLK